MRYLVISDIHSNWEALKAVLEAAEGRYGRILCCGDLVGYGPSPNAVVDWVRANVAAVVRGNHDKASCGISDAQDFNSVARAAALWTRQELSVENMNYLRSLPAGPLLIGGFQIVHGSVHDEDEYVFLPLDAQEDFDRLGYPLTFFGHTHQQGGFVRVAPQRINVVQAPRGAGITSADLELREREQYLLNPGSVGQPRDGDPRAAFAIYDQGQRGVVEYWRAPYDIAATQCAMARAALPEILIQRLALGR
jgi:predicted phosphodiesterase